MFNLYLFNEPLYNLDAVQSYLHVILEASYDELSYEANRAFVIGQDDYGADVTGKAHNTTESSLVGERLEVFHTTAITSASVASSIASAILAHARLGSRHAVITIPPHCGVELWDVVGIVDEVANQSAEYRVIGYALSYDTEKGIYQHEIELCAV